MFETFCQNFNSGKLAQSCRCVFQVSFEFVILLPDVVICTFCVSNVLRWVLTFACQNGDFRDYGATRFVSLI